MHIHNRTASCKDNHIIKWAGATQLMIRLSHIVEACLEELHLVFPVLNIPSSVTKMKSNPVLTQPTTNLERLSNMR